MTFGKCARCGQERPRLKIVWGRWVCDGCIVGWMKKEGFNTDGMIFTNNLWIAPAFVKQKFIRDTEAKKA